MTYCAIKKYCMAYSVFVGSKTAEEILPDWLENAYDTVYEDEYKYYCTNDIKLIGEDLIPFDSVLMEGYDVFLRNFKGNVMRITMDQFEKDLKIIADGTVAMNQHCHKYFIFTERKRPVDYTDKEWFLIQKYKPEDATVFIFVDENKVNMIPLAEFFDRYYFLGNGIDWERFYE